MAVDKLGTDNLEPSVHSLVAKIIKQSQLSRDNVAEVLSVSKDTVDNWCRGRSEMRLSQFAKLLRLTVDRGLSKGQVAMFVQEVLEAGGVAAESIDTVISPAGRSRRHLVLFLCPTVLSSVHRITAQAVREYMREMGLDLVFAPLADPTAHFDAALVDLLVSKDVYGIIVCSQNDSRAIDLVLQTAAARQQPVVGLSTPRSAAYIDRIVGSVSTDNFLIGYEAVEFLKQQGYSKPAFMGPFWSSGNRVRLNIHDRLLGFNAAMGEAGLDTSPGNVFFGPPTDEEGKPTEVLEDIPGWLPVARLVVHAMEEGEVDAVFCAHDTCTNALLIELGRSSWYKSDPRKCRVAAATINNCRHTIDDIPVAYFQVPAYEMGREAARLLIKLASEESPPASAYNYKLNLPYTFFMGGGAATG